MCETLTTTSRRVLNLPAIQPSDEVSSYTLVDSLIHLAAKICGYRSKFFGSNERNARESTRQVGVLLVFLEEIRDSMAELPDCVVPSLSDLHVAFQKLRFLLEDCSRDGARLWMLANSELVARLFRSLMRSISSAMELFPIDRIKVGEEMRQHVELAMQQARESSFDLDSADESFLMIVHSVLFGFESGVIPDRGVLKQVLDYLGIKSWSKCHEEAKFLESETELERQKSKGRAEEASSLSSLTGFVCYCRCTAFEEVDTEPIRRSNRDRRAGQLIGINEDDLRCPISLEIMSHPVAIASGHSYDRVSIAKWFAAGNSTCPKTGEKLPTTDIVPNPSLRRLIQLYCLEKGIEIPDPGHRNRTRSKREANLPLSFAAEKAAELTGIFLAKALESGTPRRKNKAAHEVRVFSKSNGFNRACLIESGAVGPLLRLSTESSTAALLNLSKNSDAREEIFRLGGSEAMARLVRDGPGSEARHHAAGVLFYLASSTEDRRAMIGSNPDTIPGLVGLIRTGPSRGKKNALAALLALLAHQGNVWRALSCGIVDVLGDLLASGDFAADSLAILSVLAEDFDGAGAVIGFVDSAIKILNSSESRSAKEQSASLLLALCKNRERDVVYVLAKSKGVMGSLYLLLTQGTSRAGKKASELIRILHDVNERRSSGMAPILNQERVIRAW